MFYCSFLTTGITSALCKLNQAEQEMFGHFALPTNVIELIQL